MKIIRQFGIIFTICWLGTAAEHLLPFAFPASVIAMLLLLICLLAGILKVEHIREKSDFLLANMAFFFIPAGVNVINYLDILKYGSYKKDYKEEDQKVSGVRNE